MSYLERNCCPYCYRTDCICSDYEYDVAEAIDEVTAMGYMDQAADDFLGTVDDAHAASQTILKAAGVPKRTWGCSDPKCSASTGICDSMTFGKGRLCNYGYWEFPCFACARAWEADHPGDICWPFASREDMQAATQEPRQERYML